MNAGRVLFVGCGPGAADLLTLRAVEAIERAGIVIWSPSLIDRRVLVERMRPGLATPRRRCCSSTRRRLRTTATASA